MEFDYLKSNIFLVCLYYQDSVARNMICDSPVEYYCLREELTNKFLQEEIKMVLLEHCQ